MIKRLERIKIGPKIMLLILLLISVVGLVLSKSNFVAKADTSLSEKIAIDEYAERLGFIRKRYKKTEVEFDMDKEDKLLDPAFGVANSYAQHSMGTVIDIKRDGSTKIELNKTDYDYDVIGLYYKFYKTTGDGYVQGLTEDGLSIVIDVSKCSDSYIEIDWTFFAPYFEEFKASNSDSNDFFGDVFIEHIQTFKAYEPSNDEEFFIMTDVDSLNPMLHNNGELTAWKHRPSHTYWKIPILTNWVNYYHCDANYRGTLDAMFGNDKNLIPQFIPYDVDEKTYKEAYVAEYISAYNGVGQSDNTDNLLSQFKKSESSSHIHKGGYDLLYYGYKGSWSCKTMAVCDICGSEYTTPFGAYSPHQHYDFTEYVKGNYAATPEPHEECTVCGLKCDKHVFNRMPENCQDTDFKCEECDLTGGMGLYKGRHQGAGTCKEDSICTLCGATYGTNAEEPSEAYHVFVGEGDKLYNPCTLCGYNHPDYEPPPVEVDPPEDDSSSNNGEKNSTSVPVVNEPTRQEALSGGCKGFNFKMFAILLTVVLGIYLLLSVYKPGMATDFMNVITSPIKFIADLIEKITKK